MDQTGRTLLEIAVVLGIVGTLAVMTGESFLGATVRTKIRVVRAEVASELRLAHALALHKKKPVQVVFDSSGRSVRTEEGNGTGMLRPTYEFSSSGVVVDSLSNGRTVTFYANGRTASPTTIVFRSERDGYTLRLTVSLVGRVNCPS